MVRDSLNLKCDLISRFTGEMVRVITGSSHYRGECLMVDIRSNDIFLKDVLRKVDSGWAKVTDLMFIGGPSVEVIYVELGYPFELNESLILSVENGQISHSSDMDDDHDLEGLL